MKSVFAVFAAERPDLLAPKIRSVYSSDAIELERGQWLVSDDGTSQNVCDRLGIITRDANGTIGRGPTGSAMVVAVSGYYGVASANIWEWIRAHWGGGV